LASTQWESLRNDCVMPDPLSTAVAAFTAIKAGVSAGRQIQDLAKDIGKLWDGIDQAKQQHNKKKASLFSSVNEEAMDTFIAKKRAEDLEDQLRQIVIATRGMTGWQELIRLRAEIRKRRQQEKIDKAKRIEDIKEQILLAGLIILIVCGVLFVGYLIAKKQGLI